MSDHDPYSAQTATVAPPAPPSGPPAISGTATDGLPPKKRRTGLIIAIVAVVLLICLPAACIGGTAGFGLLRASEDRETVLKAEERYARATGAVEAAKATLDAGSENPGADEIKAIAEQASGELRTARGELAAARAIIEELDESEGTTAYLGSLDAAGEALAALEGVMVILDGAGDLVKRLDQAADASAKGAKELNDAISAGNGERYSTMRSKAQAASTSFAEATTIFEAAHDSDPTAGLDTAAEYARALKKQADLVRAMADDGAAGKVAAYNKKIKELEELAARIEGMDEPAIISDPEWFDSRLGDLSATVDAGGARADELHLKALQEFGLAKR